MARYFGCCPSELPLEQLREYQVHLAGREDISVSYYKATVTALRFMYRETSGVMDRVIPVLPHSW